MVVSHILSCTRKFGIVSHKKNLVVWCVLRTVKDLNTQSQQVETPNQTRLGPLDVITG